MPISNAIGIVQNTAKVPHGLPVSALTTTRARTASTMTQIRRMPMPAIVPAIGPSDGREVMPVEHVAVGRDVIETVVMTNGGRRPRAIDAERPLGDEKAVEPVGYEVDANCGDDQPCGIDRFAPVERDNRERNRAQYSDPCP